MLLDVRCCRVSPFHRKNRPLPLKGCSKEVCYMLLCSVNSHFKT